MQVQVYVERPNLAEKGRQVSERATSARGNDASAGGAPAARYWFDAGAIGFFAWVAVGFALDIAIPSAAFNRSAIRRRLQHC
jgi:hypothetical protein